MTDGSGQNLVYGIDVGGTKVEIGVFAQKGSAISSTAPISSKRCPTPTHDYEELLDLLQSLVEEADTAQGAKPPIGIGMPGIRDASGSTTSANVPCATGKNIAVDLGNRLDRPIAIGNDCRLFALSESLGGRGSGARSVYGAIVGTGAAGGLCIDGKLYQGRNGVAGEYGHQPASAHLIETHQLPILNCGCGLRGCYEPYISGPGLGRIYAHFGSQSTSTHDLVENLRRHEETAKAAFHCYMDFLGAAFSSIVMSYDPDIIVVGGGISRIDEVISALPEYVQRHLYAGIACPEIARARFGDASGVRGAAILGIQANEF